MGPSWTPGRDVASATGGERVFVVYYGAQAVEHRTIARCERATRESAKHVEKSRSASAPPAREQESESAKKAARAAGHLTGPKRWHKTGQKKELAGRILRPRARARVAVCAGKRVSCSDRPPAGRPSEQPSPEPRPATCGHHFHRPLDRAETRPTLLITKRRATSSSKGTRM